MLMSQCGNISASLWMTLDCQAVQLESFISKFTRGKNWLLVKLTYCIPF